MSNLPSKKGSDEANWRQPKRKHLTSIRNTEPPTKRITVRGSRSGFNQTAPSNVKLSTRPWYIRTPEDQKCALSAVPNEVSLGLLHIFIRHYPQMETLIPNLRQLRWKLPQEMRTALCGITRAPNMEAAEKPIEDLKSYIVSESETLCAIQRLIWTFLQTTVLTKTATKMVKEGSTQLLYKVDSTNRNLVLIVSDWVDPPLRFDRRNVHKIITAYLSF
uniref:Uncharacterized protein n=1 Tax=Panagrellus redivivus TaxID=6233 RepID=A0A7E4UNP7_PANRE